MKREDVINVQTEVVNLKNDISELIEIFPCISAIYLFGSRAYKTNSTRSDIDLFIESDNTIPILHIQEFRREHNYLDVFIGNNISISSVANGSLITKKSELSLLVQLDAITLWTKKSGYENDSYYEQYIYKGQKFFDSARPYPRDFISLKQKLNNPLLSAECQFYFQECLVNFVNECFLSCVATFGLACESMIDDLVDSCTKKYLIDQPMRSWKMDYAQNRDSAKLRVLGLEKYFIDYKNDFKNYGFTELDITMRAFDVVRNYRNNADHPLGYQFHYEDCCGLFSSMSIHIDKILKLIDYMKANYS